MNPWTNSIVLAALLTLSASADAGGNLLANPTFDTGIAGWQIGTEGGGSVTWLGNFGNPAGSAAVSSPNPNSSASLSQCIAISAPATVDFIVDGYAANSSGSGGYVFVVFAYSADNCTGFLGNLPAGTPSSPVGIWNGFRSTLAGAALPAGTKSVFVMVGSRAEAAAGSLQNYYIDNVYFGSDSIFTDGFEP